MDPPSRTSGTVHRRDDDEGGAPPVRRMRPRHFHAGPNPPAAQASAAAAPSAPPVLHADALASIFQFLDLPSMITVLRVSREWRGVVRDNVAGVKLQCYVEFAELSAASQSPLARHIERLVIDELSREGAAILVQPQWSRLNALVCSIDASQTQPLAFPSALRQLALPVRDATEDGMRTLLDAIGLLTHLTKLEMTGLPRSFSLGSLQHVNNLMVLEIIGEVDEPQEQRDHMHNSIRGLTHLRRFHCFPLSAADLMCLLRAPHQLDLEMLDSVDGLDDVAAALLPSLPSLQRLGLGRLTVSSFTFASQLPQLRELSLTCSDMPDHTRAGMVASAAAGHFVQLRELSLRGGQLTVMDLTALLAGMPELNKLGLVFFFDLDSLSFFTAVPHLAASLTELQMTHCPELPLTELEHLHGLKQLRFLNLRRCFDERMPLYVQRLFTPGLPQLTFFSPPGEDEEADDD